MIAWTKAVHIVALSVWCAGLLVLPAIYYRRRHLRGAELHDLHRFARLVFINITSPAAFVTVIAGTALFFLREVFTIWMALKLVAVGALVIVHLRMGHVILSLFNPGRVYARWRQVAATITTLAAITAILFLVLAKPVVEPGIAPDWTREPGGLQSLLETIIPIP
jgi:protoporphyrinogen IX oxidase